MIDCKLFQGKMKLSSDDEAWLKIRNEFSLNFNIDISFVYNKEIFFGGDTQTTNINNIWKHSFGGVGTFFLSLAEYCVLLQYNNGFAGCNKCTE